MKQKLKPSLALTLRAATADVHESIEQLPVMRRLTSDQVTAADYLRYLSALAPIYEAVEAALYEGLETALRERLGLRPKLPALRHDLAQQEAWQGMRDITEGLGAAASSGYHPHGADAIVGGLYVLEGATLGGRTIARHLRRRLGQRLGDAVFLDFHGKRTSAAWKHFSATIDALCREGILTSDAVVAGAVVTFEIIHRRLGAMDAPD